MKAVLCKQFRPPESLVVEEVAEPAAGKGQVVVDIRAASVNFPDVLVIQKKYHVKPPLPFSPKISPDQVALSSTHTHTAPCLARNLPTLFGEPRPPKHQAHIDRYTRELIDALEKVALQALRERKAARLSWGQTKAGFAPHPTSLCFDSCSA